ncbi:hypothetical protein [Streptomyces sp. NPDC051567]|uniref:hypothetical protein n=1 Tax=Streptomyces sp. NPDC051567 TaxID=3365660 RepID=UPI0037A10BCB
MKSIPRTRCARTLAAGVLSAALLTAGTATGAFAATPTPHSTPSTHSSTHPAVKSVITVKANKTEVKAGDTVTFTGRAKGLKPGSKVVLQHKNNGKWTTLKASTTVKNDDTYTLNAKLNTKGKQQLRVKDDKTTSLPVVVTVN